MRICRKKYGFGCTNYTDSALSEWQLTKVQNSVGIELRLRQLATIFLICDKPIKPHDVTVMTCMEFGHHLDS